MKCGSKGGLRIQGPILLALLGLFAYALTIGVTPLANNDVWIHLTTGRPILEEGEIPRTDRYSDTAQGNRYVAHEWLAATLPPRGPERVDITPRLGN